MWLPATSRGSSFDPQRFDPAGPAFSDDVELILQGIGSRHNSEGQDNDQPDYDSVASDEDPVQEATCADSGNDGRTKVRIDAVNFLDPVYTNLDFLEMHMPKKCKNLPYNKVQTIVSKNTWCSWIHPVQRENKRKVSTSALASALHLFISFLFETGILWHETLKIKILANNY